MTLPIYIGNIPVSQARLGLRHSISQVPAPVVPSAPPADDDQCGSTQPMDNVSIPTKCHSQQQANAPFCYASELNFPNAQMENLGSPSHPTLCLSTGSTIPYYAEGAVVPVPTAGSLILPPEYSTWGYPYGKCSFNSQKLYLERCMVELLISSYRVVAFPNHH